MMTKPYWYISGVGMDGCSPDKAYEARARAEWLCRGCLTILPGTGPLDATIEERVPPAALNDLIGLTIIHRALVDAINPVVFDRYVLSGSVVSAGKVLPDWLCFHPKHRVIVRGERSVRFRRCEVCRRDVYSALERDYLCPAPSGDSALMSTPGGGCLIIDDGIKKKVDKLSRLKLHIHQLEILEQPRDGLARELVA